MAHEEVVYTVEEEPASPATRLFHQPKLQCFVIAILGSTVKVDLAHVKAKGLETLPNVPRFACVMVKDEKTGKLSWKPTSVDIEKHVISPVIDNNMTISKGDEYVQDYIARLTAKAMDLSKPLWEVHILNITTSDANSTTIWKIHHSVGDGISLISILLALTRKTSDPESLPTIPHKKPTNEKKPSLFRRFFYGIWVIIMIIFNSLRDCVLFVATIFFLKDTITPIKGRSGIGSSHKRIMHRSISLDDLKLVKIATDSTVNDVILGISEAGLARYLNRRYANTNEQQKGATKKSISLPKNIRMRASLIFNIRPAPGLQVFADMMKSKSKAKWGNRIGYALVPLSIAMRDDPLVYVHKAQSMINRKKLSLESRFSYSAAKLILRIFGIKVATAVTHRVLYNTTLCFSNVVGPQEEISFFGHPVKYIAPSVHGLPHALLIHFQSYINKMTIVLTYDPTVIPDPEQLLDDMEESLKLIKDAAIKKRVGTGVEP